MNLATARNYAEKIIEWIAPDCAEPPIVAGSIRRERPVCNDVDIVCIPKIKVDTDMLGEAIGHRNLLHHRLSLECLSGKGKLINGAESGKMMIIQLRACQLDLWFATSDTVGTRLLCRTGSMQHNIWLAERAKRMGLHWNPYEGLLLAGSLLKARSEDEIYATLGLPYIEPRDRELEFIKRFDRWTPKET